MGCTPQRQQRTAMCDLSADAPHQATALNSHGTAAAMRARIAGPSITHSSNKAWRTGGDDLGPAICGEPKRLTLRPAPVWNFSPVGKFRNTSIGTRTPPFLTGSGRVSGWYKSPSAPPQICLGVELESHAAGIGCTNFPVFFPSRYLTIVIYYTCFHHLRDQDPSSLDGCRG